MHCVKKRPCKVDELGELMMSKVKQNVEDIKNCSFVKTVLMLLVILGHSCCFWDGSWFTGNPVFQSKWLGLISSLVGSFHIYAFTLVSGYIFAFKVLSGGGYNHYGLFLKNKAKRLLVPYVFVMLIWVAPISAYYFKWDLPYLFKKYILCISPSQLWFLWMLFGVFAIVWPLRNLIIKKPFVGWIISLVLYGVGAIGGRFIPNVFCIWTACLYVVFFFIGMRIRVKGEEQKKLFTDVVPWFCWVIEYLLLFAGNRLIGHQDGFIWSVISLGMEFLLRIVGALMAWTSLHTVASKVHWQENKVFKTLTCYSMPMYLFHQQIIYFTITQLNGVVNPWINASVNFVAAIAGSLIISALLMRWSVTRILVGEKRFSPKRVGFSS